MSPDQQTTSFPEFSTRSLIIQAQKGKKKQSPQKQKSDSQKKRQLIESLTKNKPHHKKQNIEDNEFTCLICHQYFVKPVTTKCGHSFCDFCLQEFFLFSKQCPHCHQNIRGTNFTYNNVLNEFVEGFIKNNHKQYIKEYEKRLKNYKIWKTDEKPLQTFRAGMHLDVRDQNFVWCKGIVIRVISRIGDPVKFLKVQYKTQNMQIRQEQIRSTNERVASQGFYTNRKQLPKYKDLLQQSPNKKQNQ